MNIDDVETKRKEALKNYIEDIVNRRVLPFLKKIYPSFMMRI